MDTGNLIIIGDKKSMDEFTQKIARMVTENIIKMMKEPKDPDPYLDAHQLEEELPSMRASTIKDQIRKGKYGKKIGAKGKLVAKASEVRRHNRL
jgi:hypothetical protein